MSDSEASIAIPPDSKIESTFLTMINRIWKSGDHDNLTVKRIRKAVEQELDLPENWFKDDKVWNAKSKQLSEKEVGRLQEEGDEESEGVAPVVKEKKAVRAKAPQKRKKPEVTSTKRKATPKAQPRKKRKILSDEEDEESEEEQVSSLSEEERPSPPSARKQLKSRTTSSANKSKNEESRKEDEEEVDSSPNGPTKRRANSKLKAKIVESDEDEDDDDDNPPKPADRNLTKSKPVPKKKSNKVLDSDDEDVKMKDAEHIPVDISDLGADVPKTAPIPTSTTTHEDGNASSSSLSSLLDEPPKKKREKKAAKASKTTTSSKAIKPTPSKPKKATKEIGPDEEEIKRLQSWLVKCGIRKVWGKELLPFSTPKAKIAHLKSMLADAGMTGRYSNEKAASIKERRELAADLEAVQDFDGKWGNKDERERPKRRNVALDLGLDESLIESDGDEED